MSGPIFYESFTELLWTGSCEGFLLPLIGDLAKTARHHSLHLSAKDDHQFQLSLVETFLVVAGSACFYVGLLVCLSSNQAPVISYVCAVILHKVLAKWAAIGQSSQFVIHMDEEYENEVNLVA